MSPLERGGRMDKVTMSKKELTRLEIMARLKEKRMTQIKAAEILGISPRQVKRLWKRYRESGPGGLVSGHRGKPSNNRLSEDRLQAAIDWLHKRYSDFGPTLACEKLGELHQLHLSVGSVRKIMIEEGLWKPRRARKVVAHQMRERRACVGEMVQIDGSPFDWFEGRAAACTLLVFIDDATGQLGELMFVKSESFFSYCQGTRNYFARHGKPTAFYSDKHGVFRVNMPNNGSGDNLTQFGRAMQELGIKIICANTPQAKGRVERANQTLQDRLPKELRLRGISDWQAGNEYLPQFMEDFNRRFAVQPRSGHNAHRPVSPHEDLNRIFTWQEERVLSKNLTCQFDNVVYQIQTKRSSLALRKARVMVCLDEKGEITILRNGKSLPYSVFNRQEKQSEIVPSKEIDQALRIVTKAHKPAPNHPWRKTVLNINPRIPSGDIST